MVLGADRVLAAMNEILISSNEEKAYSEVEESFGITLEKKEHSLFNTEFILWHFSKHRNAPNF